MTTSTSSLSTSTVAGNYYEASVGVRPAYAALHGALSCDVCVIGAGFTGLHTALELVQAGLRVVVLEAQQVGAGASGRNGGQVIPEFSCGLDKLARELGLQAAQRFNRLAYAAVERLRARIAQYDIACDYRAGHVQVAMKPREVAYLRDWQSRAARDYGVSLQWLEGDALRQHVSSPRYLAGLRDPLGGHVHPLKLVLGLARGLVHSGGALHEHSAVQQVEQVGEGVRVRGADFEVRAARVVLAVNKGMDSLQGEVPRKLARRILPVTSWIIGTEPLGEALARAVLPQHDAVVDCRFILNYFRLSADQRMLFGGRCSYLAWEQEPRMRGELQAIMGDVFPQLASARVDYSWGGQIDISMSRAPDFGRHGAILHAQGFSGSGVAASCAAGHALASAVLGERLRPGVIMTTAAASVVATSTSSTQAATQSAQGTQDTESQAAAAAPAAQPQQAEPQQLELFMRLHHRDFPGGRWLRAPLTALGMAWYRLRDML